MTLLATFEHIRGPKQVAGSVANDDRRRSEALPNAGRARSGLFPRISGRLEAYEGTLERRPSPAFPIHGDGLLLTILIRRSSIWRWSAAYLRRAESANRPRTRRRVLGCPKNRP